MTREELKIGQRVRVPATEKVGGGSNHYARVTDFVDDPFTGEPLAVVWIAATKQEKVLALAGILPERKQPTIKQSTK